MKATGDGGKPIMNEGVLNHPISATWTCLNGCNTVGVPRGRIGNKQIFYLDINENDIGTGYIYSRVIGNGCSSKIKNRTRPGCSRIPIFIDPIIIQNGCCSAIGY